MRIHTVYKITAVRIPKPTAPKKSGMCNCTADLALDCVHAKGTVSCRRICIPIKRLITCFVLGLNVSKEKCGSLLA